MNNEFVDFCYRKLELALSMITTIVHYIMVLFHPQCCKRYYLHETSFIEGLLAIDGDGSIAMVSKVQLFVCNYGV